MVTLIKMPRRWEDGTYNFGFAGLSTDRKPIKEYDEKAIANASSFFAFDILKIYFYDRGAEKWILPKTETASGTSSGASSGGSSGTSGGTTNPSAMQIGGSDNKIKYSGLAVGKENSIGYNGLAVGNSNKVDGSALAVGYGNDVSNADQSAAVGMLNTVKGVDAMAIGSRLTAEDNQCVVGANFAGISQWQSRAGFPAGAFPFIVAANDNEGSGDFNFAVPCSALGGIIIRGRKGSITAYYYLTIQDGQINIRDITDRLQFKA